MEKIVEGCKFFSKKIKCDLNTTAQECETAKASLTKYCSSKECQGDYGVFAFKTTKIILATTHALIDCLLKSRRISLSKSTRTRSWSSSGKKTMREAQISVKLGNIIRQVAYQVQLSRRKCSAVINDI